MALDIPNNKEIFRQRDVRETEPRFTAGEGIDISTDKIISGEDATTTNKGISSFNTDDFSVSSGAVSLKNKTSYVSIPGAAFKATHPNSDDVIYSNVDNCHLIPEANTLKIMAPVFLPHGAVVTSVIVYGVGWDTWTLYRDSDAGVKQALASAGPDTADTTISNATIDNSTYYYYLDVRTCDIDEEVKFAVIGYTTDYN